MSYPDAAWERAMKVQEVIMKALTGELHWYRAADILGFSPRTLRRWRERYEAHGYDGLLDLRRRTPSPKRVPVAEVTRIVQLYRAQYRGFNGRHFHQIARREHGVTLSYSFVKQALQLAGLLKKSRARGRHRRRRPPRACFGELLHIDGSPHAWLALRPAERSVLIAVLDDATKRVLYAALWPSETTAAIMTALRHVITVFGLPMAIYTDRAHWAFNTPHAKGPVEGQGSGVIVDKGGYIVTNSHVVHDAERIQVRLSDRRNAIATVIADDPMMDIAILKIELPNLIPAEWGDSDKLQEGDLVWAIGSPFGLERSLTFGIVSNKTRRSGSRLSGSHLSDSPYQEYLQTDAAVNPGNSGGPLVNIDGQVVGINAAIFGPAYQGISFAIPSALVRERYDELKTNGRIERAWLGILPLDVPDDVRAKMKLELGEGVYVATVDRNAPAGRVGLRPGDVILKWNEHLATDPTLLSREIARTPIGSTARLTILRATGAGNERLDLDVEVERRRPDER